MSDITAAEGGKARQDLENALREVTAQRDLLERKLTAEVAQGLSLRTAMSGAISILGGSHTEPITHALGNAAHAAASKLRSADAPASGAELIGRRLIAWVGQALGRKPTTEDIDCFRNGLDRSLMRDMVAYIVAPSAVRDDVNPPQGFIAKYHAIKAGHFDRIAQLVGADGEPLDESVARIVKQRDELLVEVQELRGKVIPDQALSEMMADAQRSGGESASELWRSRVDGLVEEVAAANESRLKAEVECSKLYERCAALKKAADAGERDHKDLMFLENQIEDAEGVVNQILIALGLFGAEASASAASRLVAHLRQVLDGAKAIIGEREAAQRSMRQVEQQRDIGSGRLVTAMQERDDALAEAARRYDCHGGPGTTEPACRACVTCLLRDLEARDAEVKRQNGSLSRAEVIVKTLEEQLAHVRRLIHGWLEQQGHDRRWYYPAVFRALADALGIVATTAPSLPVLAEFQEGCRRYQSEEYRLPFAPSRGALRILEERSRQMTAEGWTPEHDAEHVQGEMAMAAACYAAPERIFVPRLPANGILSERPGENFVDAWPWDRQYDKRDKQTRRRALEKAGALCAAELDRLDAEEEKANALRDKQALKAGDLG